MEIKQQPNQNPEDVNTNQEENADTVNQAVENHTETESPNAIPEEKIETEKGEIISDELGSSATEDESYDFGTENTESEDEDDDEDDEETLSDDELEAQYTSFKLPELFTVFEVLINEEELQNIRSKVVILKRIIEEKLCESEKSALEAYLAEGGIEAEFSTESTDDHIQYRKVLGLYGSKRAKFREIQEQNQNENLAKKKELLEELRMLVNSDESLKSTYDKFKEIQDQWKEIGMIPKNEMGELWKNYHFLVEKFFDKVKISNELRDLDLKKSLEAKVLLCEKAEELLLENSITKSFKLLQKYHEEWKTIGPVPSHMKEEVWERFKAISDKINQRRREYYNQQQDRLEDNYKAKLELCGKVEAINLSAINSIKEWNKSTDTVNELFKEWKSIGQTPRKVNEEVWHRFKSQLNGFFTAKKKFFNEIKEEQNHNYQLKLAICAEAEAMQSSTNWKKTSDALIKLQKDWKNIGPVPRKYSDSIWKRFRLACDTFFESKTKHFKGMVESESENAKLKSALIQEIKSADFGKDKAANLELIKGFQRKWIEIGNVPRKDMDKLNKAYREAIDSQLDKFNISKSDFRHSGFKEKIHNMKENDDNYHLNKERYGIQKTMEKLQEDVLLWENNMGFFANTKNAEVLKMEFEKKIEHAKAEIGSLKEKLRIIDRG